MLTTIIIVGVLTLAVALFMQHRTFGKTPDGKRLERIEKSPNYKNGSFQNLSETPVQAENASFFSILKDFFTKSKRTEPSKPIPFVRTDLKHLNVEKPTIIWFGHSSYLIKLKDKNILVDPVFSGFAAPVPFLIKAFKGSNHYSVNDLPKIDMMIISHDHYDHLDYATIRKLKSKTKHFYAPLGVGAHLEEWGIEANDITELDWWDSLQVDDLKLTAAPARHFSGRSIQRGKSLWASYILETPEYKIYIGGDSGYDSHFKTIGDKYGPFDIAILETGQYNKNWPYIHMMPEQTVQAARDLNTKVLFPVHLGKFALALHDWDEPLHRVVRSASEKQVNITTPMIGEPIVLDSEYPKKEWWKN